MHFAAPSTEDRLVTLIAKGLRVSLDINTQDDTVRIKFNISQGGVTSYGGRGFIVADEGTGPEGIRLFRAGLAAAEALVGGPHSLIDALPVHLPRSSGDPLRETQRAENADIAQALDGAAVREMEQAL